MAYNTQNLSISCPKILVDFIEQLDLSPSAIFQEAIIEKKQHYEKYRTETAKLLSNLESKDKILSEIVTYLELNGFKYEDFMKWRGEYLVDHNKTNVLL